MKILFQYPFLYWDRNTSVCSSIKCHLEITAEIILLKAPNCAAYDALQAAFSLRKMAFLLGHHFCDTVGNN